MMNVIQSATVILCDGLYTVAQYKCSTIAYIIYVSCMKGHQSGIRRALEVGIIDNKERI